jgi:nitrile hydratase accessory protein
VGVTSSIPLDATSTSPDMLLSELDGPAFAEPWMAQAFACTVHLSRRGLFTWNEWVEVFSTEIKANPQQHAETSNAAYYRQWLAALETIVARNGTVSSAEINERQETWRQAYLNTPHGQPVELLHATSPPVNAASHHLHGHHHHNAPEPVSVSSARR